MTATKPAAFLALASLLLSGRPAAAQEGADPSAARGSVLADLRETGSRLSCSSSRVLEICGSQGQSRAPRYKAAPAQDRHFNAFQRLAGMIADRMEAGNVGNVKIRFKILLE